MVGKSRRYGGNVVNGRCCLAYGLVIWAVLPIIMLVKSAQAGSTQAIEPVEPTETIGIASIYRLYPEISQEQSDLAHIGLQKGYSGDFAGALKLYAKMEKLETRDSLAPLSQLLIVATGVLMLERSDFRDEDELARIAKTVEEASEQGHYLCRKALETNKNHPTYMLIIGGIQGFLATRKIHTQPTRALQDGFHALRLLEKTIKIDPRIKDAYMGQGIFDCTASNAPLVVRGALKLLGRSSNFNQGLRALRVSAYSGQYTSVASQLFLIQFLSPYEDESVAEKQDIFVGLKTAFPTNPMYDFLANDEALCFYPDSFYSRHAAKSPAQIEKGLRKLRPHGYAGARYLQLVKAQLSLLQDEGNLSAAFDTTFDWREYAYYPIFLEGLRRKREFEDSLPRRDPSIDPEEWITAYRDSALTLLRQSAMTPTAKRYHAWRVRDAMKLKRKPASAIAAPSP